MQACNGLILTIVLVPLPLCLAITRERRCLPPYSLHSLKHSLDRSYCKKDEEKQLKTHQDGSPPLSLHTQKHSHRASQRAIDKRKLFKTHRFAAS
ncbi:hypothetical protein F5878DRAFT_631845 [Lentinula raphanica]|uniref:Secreted protein n=1 Tax=Lentinula raphanica TaxID=153919 RepID=A0AA38U912_9AGAR|nr:hypothetical protein F5878DRAFT_631845 [Lentinula raphanica]